MEPELTVEPIEQPINEVELMKQKLSELKAVNDAYDAERLRAERARANQAMAGRVAFVPPAPVETEHDKWVREAKIRYKGTGMDPT